MARIRRLTIEDYVCAILDRDEGIPYSRVLERHRITPTQFCLAVRQKINDLIQATSGETRRTLEAISKDAVRERELFNMGEEFIREQYDRVRAGTQSRLYKGTLFHPENIKHLVYYALTSNNPQLTSTNRKKIIAGIKNLPVKLAKYFFSLKMSGLMTQGFEKNEKGSPLAVLKVFDRVYMRRTGDASLFDLNQKEHLHEWGDNFVAPQSYWQDSANVKRVVYHLLTETNPKLASTNRREIVAGIKSLPTNLKNYFNKIGLAGLMTHAFGKRKQSSPIAVLEVFDRIYMKRTGDASLFDLTQEEHLHRWGDNFMAASSYWKDPVNVEEAIYHVLTENNPQLTSENREEVIEGIKNLPRNLRNYFTRMGLSGLMTQAFEKRKQNSSLAVLEVFDRIYQRKTGDASLFDKTQDDYLEFESRNILVR